MVPYTIQDVNAFQIKKGRIVMNDAAPDTFEILKGYLMTV
jgi:hypothetical protein